MKNNNTPPQWIVDDMKPMLQCADGSSPTVTARCSNAGIVNMLQYELSYSNVVNMLDLAHYPIQGVLVQGHYE